MKKKFIVSLILTLAGIYAFSQQLPANACGIVNTYDAAGNRLKRVYFCNNGIDPYPTRAAQQTTNVTEEIQSIDALYPNPTTGRFFVTFSKALSNAVVSLTDVNGKTIRQFKASGYRVDFDLSAFAAGVYFVLINDAGNIISKKVVKQ
ncbi:T9SS type A sorting domain-containing protein [Pseudoflavitalea sp. X16]|uniref:T9SS type A sorting domain-containing protein n=1 Tax=Paraflavitalea devenefica TaxID=2716334 RepID=UPI0014226ED3|nr:T9SS type A sorting domain-containing protein [Paraflavitalea devenefica]NII25716.1 T9SS type A sorting domain-containing protein [Paraflavitalea devenefica]